MSSLFEFPAGDIVLSSLRTLGCVEMLAGEGHGWGEERSMFCPTRRIVPSVILRAFGVCAGRALGLEEYSWE